MAEKLKFLRIIIPSQCLLRALHVENVEEEFSVLVFDHAIAILGIVVAEGCAVH